MRCDNCGTRPAAVELHQRLDGRDAVIHLCNHCASAMAAGLAGGADGAVEHLVEGLMGPRLRGRGGLMAQLSEMAQRVLQRAAEEAVAWGQPRVAVELVLLAILREVPEIRERLRASGLEVDGYAAQLERVVPRGPPREAGEIGLSSGLKRVLQIARMQAARLGHGYIGPEHLLVAIALDGESEIETPVSRLMLRGEVREGDLLRVDFVAGAFSFTPERRRDPEPPAGPERPEASAGMPQA